MEKEIEVVASSATATLEHVTHMVVADVRHDFQAQLEQTCAESQCRDADAKRQMDEIAANLATLTNQLNRFKPASVADVSGSQEQLSSAVDERINLQSQRIDTVSESMQEVRKTAQENSEILRDLLVGMENLGESVKQLWEEVNAWGGPEDQEVLNDLMKEVPMVPSIPSSPRPLASPQL